MKENKWEKRILSSDKHQTTPKNAMVGVNGTLVMKTNGGNATELFYIGGQGYTEKRKNLVDFIWEINWKGYWKVKSEHLKYPFFSGFAVYVPEEMFPHHLDPLCV